MVSAGPFKGTSLNKIRFEEDDNFVFFDTN